MASSLRKVGPVPSHLAHVRKRANAIVDLHNKPGTGILIGDNKTIVVTKLADGRYRLSLHPSIVAQFQ